MSFELVRAPGNGQSTVGINLSGNATPSSKSVITYTIAAGGSPEQVWTFGSFPILGYYLRARDDNAQNIQYGGASFTAINSGDLVPAESTASLNGDLDLEDIYVSGQNGDKVEVIIIA